jgi:Protein of unknown function (DUF3152)
MTQSSLSSAHSLVTKLCVIQPLYRISAIVLCVVSLLLTGSSLAIAQSQSESTVEVDVSIESLVPDVSSTDLTDVVISTLNDPRGWARAGFHFVASTKAKYKIVLAEPKDVDRRCAPLKTDSKYSCQNGPIVAFNANRYRKQPSFWKGSLQDYRQYLVNHEVGHLFGQRHPTPRCPAGGLAAVMEQQTKGLEGCTENPWPLVWEIDRAKDRPIVWAPKPDWAPNPVPVNNGGAGQTLPPLSPVSTSEVSVVAATSSSIAEPTAASSVVDTIETTVRTPTITAPVTSEVSGAVPPQGPQRTSQSKGYVGLIIGVLVAALGGFALYRRKSKSSEKLFDDAWYAAQTNAQTDTDFGNRVDQSEPDFSESTGEFLRVPRPVIDIPMSQSWGTGIVKTAASDGYRVTVLLESEQPPHRVAIDRIVAAGLSHLQLTDCQQQLQTELARLSDHAGWGIVGVDASGFSFLTFGTVDMLAQWTDGRIRRANPSGDFTKLPFNDCHLVTLIGGGKGKGLATGLKARDQPLSVALFELLGGQGIQFPLVACPAPTPRGLAGGAESKS